MSKKKKKHEKYGKLFYKFLTSVTGNKKKHEFNKSLSETAQELLENCEDYIYRDNERITIPPTMINNNDDRKEIAKKVINSVNSYSFNLLDDQEQNKFIESTICYELGIEKDDIKQISFNDIYKNIKYSSISIVFTVTYINNGIKNRRIPNSLNKSYLIDPDMLDKKIIQTENEVKIPSVCQFALILSKLKDNKYTKLTITNDVVPWQTSQIPKKYEYEIEY